MSGQRACDSGKTLSKIRVTLKIQGEATDRTDALDDASSAEAAGKTECIFRYCIEGQQLPLESELAQEVVQTLRRACVPKQRGSTLESLHPSSVVAPTISAYIV